MGSALRRAMARMAALDARSERQRDGFIAMVPRLQRPDLARWNELIRGGRARMPNLGWPLGQGAASWSCRRSGIQARRARERAVECSDPNGTGGTAIAAVLQFYWCPDRPGGIALAELSRRNRRQFCARGQWEPPRDPPRDRRHPFI